MEALQTSDNLFDYLGEVLWISMGLEIITIVHIVFWDAEGNVSGANHCFLKLSHMREVQKS